jgi:O-methyltransferase
MNEKLNFISQFAYSYPQTVQNSFDMVIDVLNKNIDGDFVECGVAAGAQIGAFQYALIVAQKSRKIWAFDSYEGIPLAGEYDAEQAGIGKITHDKYLPIEQRLISSGITCHSVDNVKENFSKWSLPIDNVEFVKGWFQNTLPEFDRQIEKISILRLDGDLHESTLVCLNHLYPKVSKGGVVIIDDYALEGCRVAVKQYFDKIGQALPEMICVDGYGVHYFIKINVE